MSSKVFESFIKIQIHFRSDFLLTFLVVEFPNRFVLFRPGGVKQDLPCIKILNAFGFLSSPLSVSSIVSVSLSTVSMSALPVTQLFSRGTSSKYSTIFLTLLSFNILSLTSFLFFLDFDELLGCDKLCDELLGLFNDLTTMI